MNVVPDRRIALFVPYLGGGGAERVMQILACELAKLGYSVDLVLASATGEYIEELDERINIVDLDAKRVASCIPGLIRYFRYQRPDALLATVLHANLAALIAAIASRTSARIVVRETNSPLGETSLPKSRWQRFQNLLARLLYRRADQVVVSCESLVPQIISSRSVPAQKVARIYNPVQVEIIKEKAQQSSGHRWLDQREAPVILAAGRLVPQKDFPTLIEAFSIVRRELSARLIILGDGQLRAELTKFAESLGIKDDVDFPGFASNPYAFMSRASVFASSSLWEGLPNSLLEALALGVPIVSTDCETGPREILRDGADGILVPVGDVSRFAEGLYTALSADSGPIVGRESIDRFRVDSVVQQYIDVFW